MPVFHLSRLAPVERNVTVAAILHSTENQEHKTKTILVVEDETAIGEFIVALLRMETPYQAFSATDARQALERMKTVIPDLFLIDYWLPDMNGLELLDRLHGSEALKHIPILLMSANPPKQELKKRHLTFIQKKDR